VTISVSLSGNQVPVTSTPGGTSRSSGRSA